MLSDVQTLTQPPVAMTMVFREQLRLIWDRDKWQLLALLVFFLIFGQALYYRSAFATLLILFLAGIWGERVWRDEETGRLSYGLAMPYQVQAHRLLRVAAGAVWFLGVFLLGTSSQIVTHLNPDPMNQQLLEMPAWLVLAWPFALLTIYLAVSALTILNGRPAIWTAIIVAMIAVLSGLARSGLLERLGLALPGRILQALIFGDWGVATALAPNLTIPEIGLVERFGYASRAGWNHVWPTVAWFILAVLLVVTVARRHRES